MPQISSDVFPAHVKLTNVSSGQSESLTEARVFIVDRNVIVAVSTPDGPTIALDAPLAMLKGTRTQRAFSAYTNTDPAVKVEWQREGGCGCGSKLKAMNVTKFFTARAEQSAPARMSPALASTLTHAPA